LDAGGGHKGPWQMNESEYDYVDDGTVAVDAQGSVAVAWVDQAQKDVLFQVFGPTGARRFDAPVNVSRSPRIFSWLPRVVLTGAGGEGVAILWQEIVFSGGSHGGEIFFARSTDGGRHFTQPLNLSRSMAGDGKGRLDPDHWDNGSLELVAGPQGHLYAAWTDYEGTLWFSRSVDAGASFARPLPLPRGAGARPARGPALAVGGDGTVLLAWTVGEDSAADIHVAQSEDQGRSFREPHAVVASPGRADAPKLAVDRKGTVHLVYAEYVRGEPPRIRYTRSSGGGLRFERPRDVAAGGQALEAGSFPQLALDGDDRLYVLWEHAADASERASALGFSRSSDAGTTFQPATAVPRVAGPQLGFNGSQQGLLMRKLAVSPTGTLAIANSTHQPGEASHVWLIRGEARRD
jgi:hypothetical protein